MTKEKIILTDADGVLVWWVKAFDEFMNSKGHSATNDSEHEYKVSIRYQVPSARMIEYVKEFNNGPAVANMGPFADAIHYVKKLASEGFKFAVITSLSDQPQAHTYRMENLVNLFGADAIHSLVCLETGGSKHEALSKWKNSGLFWIEDHYHNAYVGHDLGLKAVLVNQPYNEHYEVRDFPVVSTATPWAEIYNLVQTEYSNS